MIHGTFRAVMIHGDSNGLRLEPNGMRQKQAAQSFKRELHCCLNACSSSCAHQKIHSVSMSGHPETFHTCLPDIK